MSSSSWGISCPNNRSSRGVAKREQFKKSMDPVIEVSKTPSTYFFRPGLDVPAASRSLNPAVGWFVRLKMPVWGRQICLSKRGTRERKCRGLHARNPSSIMSKSGVLQSHEKVSSTEISRTDVLLTEDRTAGNGDVTRRQPSVACRLVCL